MSGHDDLLRQLRASVAERRGAAGREAAKGAGARDDDMAGGGVRGDEMWGWARRRGREAHGGGSPRRRRRFPRGRRGGLLVVLIAVVVGGGVATAAQTGVLAVARHEDHPLSAREVAARVVRETSSLAACRLADPSKAATTELVALDPSARRLFPGPEDPKAMTRALALNHGGPVVAGGARRFVLPDGGTVLVWVAMGDGGGTRADPAACGQARLAQLARDEPDPGSRRRQKAAEVLATYRDTRPELQTLWIMHHHVGANSTGGGGVPLGDGRTLPSGVVVSGGGDYAGIAAPTVTRLTLDGRGVDRTVAVEDGVFAFTLRSGTGPVTLRQRAADGHVVARQVLRG